MFGWLDRMSESNFRTLCALVAFAVMAPFYVALAQTAPRAMKSYPVTLHGCYDADTCSFAFHLGMDVVVQNQQVRFCGINAPELETATKAQAIVSRDTLVGWLKAAKTIRVEIPQKPSCPASGHCDVTEKYGRWLGYVYADGVNLNHKLVEMGLAAPYALSCE